jgi:hypothetical protein
VLIGSLIVTLAMRDKLSAAGLAVGIVGLAALVAVFGMTIFGERPERVRNATFTSELTELCDLAAVKLQTVNEPAAKAISQQMATVINRALQETGAGQCVVGTGISPSP